MNFSQFITHDRDSETYYITITNELISNWKKNCNGLLIISLLTFFLQCLMEIELSMILHTDKYEHNPDRKNSRNGYREKHWETLLGRITLSVPKLRRGNYKPFFSQVLKELH